MNIKTDYRRLFRTRRRLRSGQLSEGIGIFDFQSGRSRTAKHPVPDDRVRAQHAHELIEQDERDESHDDASAGTRDPAVTAINAMVMGRVTKAMAP
jgi:hypothetical protein